MKLRFSIRSTLAILALSATADRSCAATVAQQAILDATPVETVEKGSIESEVQLTSTAPFAADFAGGFDFQFDAEAATPTLYGVNFLEGADAAGLALRFSSNAQNSAGTLADDIVSITSVTWHGLVGAAPVQVAQNSVFQMTLLGQNANGWFINVAFDYSENFSFTGFSVQGHVQSPNISNGSYALTSGSLTGFNSGVYAWAESSVSFDPDTTLITVAVIPEPSSTLIAAGMISSGLFIRRRMALR